MLFSIDVDVVIRGGLSLTVPSLDCKAEVCHGLRRLGRTLLIHQARLSHFECVCFVVLLQRVVVFLIGLLKIVAMSDESCTSSPSASKFPLFYGFIQAWDDITILMRNVWIRISL